MATQKQSPTETHARPKPRNRTVRAFVDGLERLERERDDSALLNLFAGNCSVSNMQLQSPLSGEEGARRFWHDYRETFSEVESTFNRIVETRNTAVLEWTSKGKLRIGRPIEYRGVSILTLDGDKIAGFIAYYDSAPFTAHL